MPARSSGAHKRWLSDRKIGSSCGAQHPAAGPHQQTSARSGGRHPGTSGIAHARPRRQAPVAVTLDGFEDVAIQSEGDGNAVPCTRLEKLDAGFGGAVQRTGAVQLDGTLRIFCHLPETDVPGGFEEGVRLAVDGVINFNREAGGNTLFVVIP